MLSRPLMHRFRSAALASPPILLALAILATSSYQARTREETKTLLDTGKTVLAQPFSYPTAAPAKVTAAIVTMLPGEETGWHKHDVPMFGLILDGEVTVDYGPAGRRVYRKGDALIEAVDWEHNGRNTGSGNARILAVFMGADGVPNTVLLNKSPQ